MKLLVLAQTPPPHHGQSRAVQLLLETLRAEPDAEIAHVNLRLSRTTADIGRWQPGKPFAVLVACARAIRRHRRGMQLYYVPAPAKRGALYRDLLVMALCRPFFGAPVLHWHAVGLGEWLATKASPVERWLARRLLGGAALAIAQAEATRADAMLLAPRRCVVVRNGVPDPAPGFTGRTTAGAPFDVLFVGLGCREKGLFDALEGVVLAHGAEPGFRLTAIGPFASAADEREFHARAAELGGVARHRGFVSDAERNRLLSRADALCFPSYYPHEGQPAVLLEALAHDVPIITTRWRGIAENLPAEHVHYVEPRQPAQVAERLRAARRAGPAHGALRRHYLKHFTSARHLAEMVAALRAAGAP